jgi:EpsI family protein
MVILSACLLFGAVCISAVSRVEEVPPRDSLFSFPFDIGSWRGERLPDFEPSILAALGADEYLNRVYATSGKSYVGLYVGYYGSQRQGDTIHSPLNCLPGAGWQPLSSTYETIPITPSQSIRVNRYVVEKGADRMVVLYWYQSHGRAEPSEYWSKLFMVYDALRLNRSDAALIRITSPLLGSGTDAELAAHARATEFVKAMFPLLERHIPS